MSWGRSWLAITSFDRTTGALTAQHFYDVLPPEADEKSGAPAALAWLGDRFAVVDVHRSSSDPDTFVPALSFGDIGVADLADSIEIPMNVTTNTLPITHAGWDGEAYAIHGRNGTTLVVGRVEDDPAAVILPITPYGATPSGGSGQPVDHKTSTDPQSGTTYVFDADYDLWVSGHLRDGTPLPGTAPGPKKIQAIGLNTYAGSVPAVAATANGAWVSWRQDDETAGPSGMDTIVQRLDSNGDPIGDAFKLPFPPDPDPLYEAVALLPLGADGVRIFAASRFRIYVYDYVQSKLSDPMVLLDGPLEIASDGPYRLDARHLIALEHDGETWFGFSENSEVLRVLKVAPGCTYARKVHLGPDAGHYH